VPENCYKIKFLVLLGQHPGVIETDVEEFKIGVENELRKNHIFREVIERLKTKLIKESTKKYFITIA
jgi:hypothetical protein